MIHTLRRTIAGATCVGMLAAAAPAAAEGAGKPEDLVKYRQNVMSSLGGHAGAIAKIVKGQVDANHVMHHAEAIAAIAPTVDDIWWDNSGYDDYKNTDALPKIWENPDDFQAKIDQFQTAAQDFVKAAETGERGQIIKGFKRLGDSCGACHDNYRYEE